MSLILASIERADFYMCTSAGKLESFTDTGVVVPENFAQLFILELTGRRDFVVIEQKSAFVNFFRGHQSKQFPCDLDTTSIGLLVTNYASEDDAHNVLDEMLKYRDSEGIIQVYFDAKRARRDICVCVNVLRAFQLYGRIDDLKETLQFVQLALELRLYTNGTRYYCHPEAFLYFVSQFLSKCRCSKTRKIWTPLLRECILERTGLPGDCLQRSMRIIAAKEVGVPYEDLRSELSALLCSQHSNGSWSDAWFYKHGSSGVLLGNDGLTTSFASHALKLLLADDSPAGISTKPVT